MQLGFGNFYGLIEQDVQAGAFACSMRRADPRRTVQRHSHEPAHFVLVLEGLYASSAVGAPSISHGPLLVYNPPGTTHRDRFESDGGPFRGRFLTVSVSESSLNTVCNGRRLPERAMVLRGDGAQQISARLAHGTARPSDLLDLESDAVELVGLLAPWHVPERLPPAWLETARERMRDDPAHPLSVTALATLAGVHAVHFARVFRHHYGVGPAEYMRRWRVEHAIGLLRHTARPISEIAMATGFGDQSHLSRAVRQHTGLPPARLRRATT